MQAAKDSFYMALRDRLAALNPSRTVVVDGVAVPAILVRENLEPQFAEARPEIFYIEFGDVIVEGGTHPILKMNCRIGYASEGACVAGVDRGRELAQMDSELLRICDPPHTGMRDYSQAPSLALGSGVFWTVPDLKSAPGDVAGKQQRAAGAARAARSAELTVYFFLPEVEA